MSDRMKKPKKPIEKQFSLSCPGCRSKEDIRGSRESYQLYCGKCHRWFPTSPGLAKLICSIMNLAEEEAKAKVRASIGIAPEPMNFGTRDFTIRSD